MVLTIEEVSRHSTPKDCWLAIHGHVLDLTNFATTHPGGSYMIHKLCGKDGTEVYGAVHDSALLNQPVLDQYRIGTIGDSDADEIDIIM
mmetsp:Transcript_27039/g.76065  ORF Transcript_27039/g.76065 Transcript_27039/m.76065 type:complete len:89 (-) Transcript_27039:24-290(-)